MIEERLTPESRRELYLLLRLLGPCTEFWLCMRILIWQVACCVAAFVARHALAGWYK